MADQRFSEWLERESQRVSEQLDRENRPGGSRLDFPLAAESAGFGRVWMRWGDEVVRGALRSFSYGYLNAIREVVLDNMGIITNAILENIARGCIQLEAISPCKKLYESH
jgi:hypothetical protein